MYFKNVCMSYNSTNSINSAGLRHVLFGSSPICSVNHTNLSPKIFDLMACPSLILLRLLNLFDVKIWLLLALAKHTFEANNSHTFWLFSLEPSFFCCLDVSALRDPSTNSLAPKTEYTQLFSIIMNDLISV